MDSCAPKPTPEQQKQDVPSEYKVSLWTQLGTAEGFVKQINSELTVLEGIQQKLKAKKERLERGELSEDDIALGSKTTSAL
jgi:hypothetical protein